MAKTAEKERAWAMRKQGGSIKEIARLLNVSTSSVSYWCKDIALSNAQIARLQERQHRAALQAVLKYAEAKRAARIVKEKSIMRAGCEEVGSLSRREMFIAGLALYWGEGYKSGNGELGFTNSDPRMIVFIIKWFKDVFGVQKEDLVLRVSVNKLHELRIARIEHFWSETTGVPISQFTKSSMIQTISRKVYANSENYQGTMRVKVRRGTDLRRRILGGIEGLKESV